MAEETNIAGEDILIDQLEAGLPLLAVLPNRRKEKGKRDRSGEIFVSRDSVRGVRGSSAMGERVGRGVGRAWGKGSRGSWFVNTGTDAYFVRTSDR